MPAPKIFAILKSRKNPKIREHKIPLLFVKNAFFNKNILNCYSIKKIVAKRSLIYYKTITLLSLRLR